MAAACAVGYGFGSVGSVLAAEWRNQGETSGAVAAGVVVFNLAEGSLPLTDPVTGLAPGDSTPEDGIPADSYQERLVQVVNPAGAASVMGELRLDVTPSEGLGDGALRFSVWSCPTMYQVPDGETFGECPDQETVIVDDQVLDTEESFLLGSGDFTERHLRLRVRLDRTAPNSIQGQEGAVSYLFRAEQRPPTTLG